MATSPGSFIKNVGFSTPYSTTSVPSPRTPTPPPYAFIPFTLIAHTAQLSPNAPIHSQAYTFFREYVVNSNETGTITVDSNKKLAVLGGEDPDVADDAPRVASEIFFGAGATQSTLVAPSATVAAWKNFLKDGASTSGAQTLSWPGSFVLCALYFALGFLI